MPIAQTEPGGLSRTVREDVLGRAAIVGGLHHVPGALGMDDDADAGVLLADVLDLVDGEARVDRAVALPEQQARCA